MKTNQIRLIQVLSILCLLSLSHCGLDRQRIIAYGKCGEEWTVQYEYSINTITEKNPSMDLSGKTRFVYFNLVVDDACNEGQHSAKIEYSLEDAVGLESFMELHYSLTHKIDIPKQTSGSRTTGLLDFQIPESERNDTGPGRFSLWLVLKFQTKGSKEEDVLEYQRFLKGLTMTAKYQSVVN